MKRDTVSANAPVAIFKNMAREDLVPVRQRYPVSAVRVIPWKRR